MNTSRISTRHSINRPPMRWRRLAAGLSFITLVAAWPLTTPTRASVESCDELDPVDLLLGDDGCPGWMLDGVARTAYDVPELQALVDGGYELFVQHGFLAAAAQDYDGEVAGVPAQATLWLFNQTTLENAGNLYGELTSGGTGEPVLGWNGTGEAWFDVGLLSASILFYEECFYVRVDISVGGEEAKPDARCLAEAAQGLIQDAMPVEPGTWGGIKDTFE